MYLQFNLTKCQYSEDRNGDLIIFRKDNVDLLPNLSKFTEEYFASRCLREQCSVYSAQPILVHPL